MPRHVLLEEGVSRCGWGRGKRSVPAETGSIFQDGVGILSSVEALIRRTSKIELPGGVRLSSSRTDIRCSGQSVRGVRTTSHWRSINKLLPGALSLSMSWPSVYSVALRSQRPAYNSIGPNSGSLSAGNSASRSREAVRNSFNARRHIVPFASLPVIAMGPSVSHDRGAG